VNFSGTEYNCIKGQGIFAGATDDVAVQAMAAWNIDSVRIPLNESCWLGINGAPAAYSGAVYKTAIKKYVDRLTAHGLVSILELHWAAPGTQQALSQTPMPDRDHAADFWKDVAGTFTGTAGTVIFDPFNEPYPDNNQASEAAWTCWRDGGTCAGVAFTAAGMQELVTAIRSVGAKNLILLGGVQWAGSLSGWAAHKPVDQENNLAAAWHAYPDSGCKDAACWNTQMAPVASSVPLIVAELGDKGCAPMIATLMPWLDQKHVGYLAWTWNISKETSSCLDLITDYVTGAPTTQGQVYKNHIAALP
jgi:endoglucanase